MRLENLDLITQLPSIALHPTEDFAVVAAQHADFGQDRYLGQLWRVPLGDDSTTTLLTRGAHDRSPAISPDGSRIAFLRADVKDRAQVFVMAAQGGEPRQMTDAPLGVSSFSWSPDSSKLVYLARVPQEGRYGSWEGVSAAQESPRHITNLEFQANGLGWILDRPRQLFTLDVPDLDEVPLFPARGRAAQGAESSMSGFPESLRLTEDTVDYTFVLATADGAFVGSREDVERPTIRATIWHIDVDGKRRDVLQHEPTLTARVAALSGDRDWLYFLGHDLGREGRDFVGKNMSLYVVPVEGGDPRLISDPASTTFAALAIGSHHSVLAVEERAGHHTLCRIDPQGESVDILRGGGIHAVAGRVRDDVTVCAQSMTDRPDEVVLAGDVPQILTDFGAALRDTVPPLPVQEIEVEVGEVRIHGYVVLPEAEGPHPALLMIHGGPHAAYHAEYFDEAQVFARAGYAVVMCNPRGSSGYGLDFGRCIQGDLATLPTTDVLAFLDYAIDTFDLDPGRLGIQGGSYGGYLTAWIIAHDHRFRGAIVERGYLDPASFLGASDIGWFFSPGYTGDDLEDMNRQSPTLVADRVTTPTLVVHSEQDLRCPLSQALRYYTLLKMNGTDAELLVFPGEDHELSRSGTPWHRRERFDAMLTWWEHKLQR